MSPFSLLHIFGLSSTCNAFSRWIHSSNIMWCFASMVAQVVKICLQCRRPRFNPWIGKSPWRRELQPTPVFLPGEFPWTEEPEGFQRLRHNWATNLTNLLFVTFFFFFLVFLQGFQNLHSPTRIKPRSMVVKVQSPNNCTTREFSVIVLIKSLFWLIK